MIFDRIKRWLPGILFVLGALISAGLAARKASKRTQKQARHEVRAEQKRRDGKLNEADAEVAKANDARDDADEAYETTIKRMQEAADNEGTVADAIAAYNERMRSIRADTEPVDGTGTRL